MCVYNKSCSYSYIINSYSYNASDAYKQLGELIACLTQKRQELYDQVKENIMEAQKKQKEVYDRKHADPPKFAVGTIV